MKSEGSQFTGGESKYTGQADRPTDHQLLVAEKRTISIERASSSLNTVYTYKPI